MAGLKRRLSCEDIRSEVYNAAGVYCYDPGSKTELGETRRGISELWFVVKLGDRHRHMGHLIDVFTPRGNSLNLIQPIN